MSVAVLNERLYHEEVLRLAGRLTETHACEAVQLDNRRRQRRKRPHGICCSQGQLQHLGEVSLWSFPYNSLGPAVAGGLVELKMIFRTGRTDWEKGVHQIELQQGAGRCQWDYFLALQYQREDNSPIVMRNSKCQPMIGGILYVPAPSREAEGWARM